MSFSTMCMRFHALTYSNFVNIRLKKISRKLTFIFIVCFVPVLCTAVVVAVVAAATCASHTVMRKFYKKL